MTKKSKVTAPTAPLESNRLRAAGGGFGPAHTSDGAAGSGQNGTDPTGGG